MSDIYIPKDVGFYETEKQKLTIENATVKLHIKKILEYGPVPPNWRVQPNARYNAKTGGKKQIRTVRYIETTKGRETLGTSAL